MTDHITYCRNCAAQCGLVVTEIDGALTGVRGDRDHPISQGYFCIKGQSSLDLHNGEDRLNQSMRRTSRGDFEPIRVETALDEIHEKLSRLVEQHGPESVALYYGTGANCNSVTHSAMKAWAEALGTPYLYSSMTVDQSSKWVAMGRMGYFATGKHRAPDADVVMIVGSNPAVSHASFSLPAPNPMKWMHQARLGGTKFIVVDPRLSETARKADMHLQIKPGSDACLFAGLIHILLRETWQDAAFCERFTQSIDALKEAVRDFTPDYVAERTGIAPQSLIEAARLFSSANRKSLTTGTGASMGPHSNLTEHLVEAFNALCGGYLRAGDVMRNVGAFFGGFMTTEMVVPPNRTWDSGVKCHATDIGPINGEYPTGLLPSEIIGAGDKRIRALIVVGGNLVKALSDPDHSIPALQELDLLVTLDSRTTETGLLGHYQIATSLPYERYDFNAISEYVIPATFAQMSKPILPRRPDVIDDWEFFFGLARRMRKALGLKRPYFGVAQKDIPGPLLTIEPDQSLTAEQIVRWMVSHGAANYEELEQSPHGIRFDASETVVQAAPFDDGARLDLCPADVRAEIDALKTAPMRDSEFPYLMLSRRILDVMNSAYTNAARARRRHPSNPVFMNADDMSDLGVVENEAVEVSSRFGKIVAVVRKDAGLQRGVVSLSHGWGDPARDALGDEAFSGCLVSMQDNRQAINFMPHQTAVPVNVRVAGARH